MLKVSEAQYWKGLTLEYMTEESDCDSDDNIILERKIA